MKPIDKNENRHDQNSEDQGQLPHRDRGMNPERAGDDQKWNPPVDPSQSARPTDDEETITDDDDEEFEDTDDDEDEDVDSEKGAE